MKIKFFFDIFYINKNITILLLILIKFLFLDFIELKTFIIFIKF